TQWRSVFDCYVSEAQAIQLCQQCYLLQAHLPLVALDDITLLPCYGPVVRSWFNGAALPFSVTTV
ncbi:MAG: hypothetical protein OIF57_03115, partial [Marinobacterium sp.]|nr:hypothetical protein [Marinobacterium sp.]